MLGNKLNKNLPDKTRKLPKLKFSSGFVPAPFLASCFQFQCLQLGSWGSRKPNILEYRYFLQSVLDKKGWYWWGDFHCVCSLSTNMHTTYFHSVKSTSLIFSETASPKLLHILISKKIFFMCLLDILNFAKYLNKNDYRRISWGHVTQFRDSLVIAFY